jgi:hypothetical protein
MADRHKNRTLESEAERMRELRSASLALSSDDFVVLDPERRARTESSALEFIREYCTGCDGAFLIMPPPKTMERIIKAMQKAVESLVPYHIKMPRGHGKSSYVKGVCAWAIATGRRHFLEVVASNGKKAESMLRDIFMLFSRSPALLADYPEICMPIRKLEGKTQRCKSITVDGEPTDMKIAVDEMHFPRVQGYENSGAILLAVGFKANARGAVVGSQRPDLMIFDDLQDKEMAENPERVTKALELIKGDFLGSAGHLGGMAVFMTSTPIAAEDLSERISSDPFWTTETFRMLESYPDEWKLDGHGLWGEYATLWRNEGNARRNPAIACNKFYRKHKRQMNQGAKVLNQDNFKHTEVSAIQHAMNLLISSGEKIFDAEYQMEPHANESVFRLHPSQILARIREGTQSGWLLPDKVMTIACTDINPSYGLTTSIVSFDGDRTAFVTLNFITPTRIQGNANDTEFYTQVYNAVASVGQRIRDTGIPVDAWGIDCSGNQWKAVTDFVRHSRQVCGLEAYALAGRTDKEFNPRIATRRRGIGQNDTVLCWNKAKGDNIREYIYFNKDRYEETAQKAWLSALGAAGGLTLYDGREDQNEFASQVCAEWMVEKVAIAQDKYRYNWREGGKHDYGDAVYMAYALAGYFNIIPGNSKSPAESADADEFEIF